MKYSIQAKSEASYELLIYGTIGESYMDEESASAKNVIKALSRMPKGAKELTIKINSFGGSVAEALAIINTIDALEIKKVAVIDGIAASAGSLIAMVADEIHMHEASLMMIHAPWCGCQGNSEDLRDTADVLDKWADAMSHIYAKKTGKPLEAIQSMLKSSEEHWYTAQEALDEGFADKVLSVGKRVSGKTTQAIQATYLAGLTVGEDMEVENKEDCPACEPGELCPEHAETSAEVVEQEVVVVAEPQAAVVAEPQAAVIDPQAPPVADAVLAELRDVKARYDALVVENAKREFVQETKQVLNALPVGDDFFSAAFALSQLAPDKWMVVNSAFKSLNALVSDPINAQMKPIGSNADKAEDTPAETIEKMAKSMLESGKAHSMEAARAAIYIDNPELLRGLRGEE